MQDTKRTREPKIGPVGQKILLLLLGGLLLGLSRSPKGYFKILKTIRHDWKEINRRALNRSLKALGKSKLVEERENKDGGTTMILTERGKYKAITFQIDEMKIPPMKKWDKKWRVVLFDIPEHHKKVRDALSQKLKHVGFHQLQKSVFIHPFECKKEIDFILEFLNMRPYVRIITADQIDNELFLKKYFRLI